ncbi:uncharacterized protein LOC142850660 [Microtus pennsylvanicus]|uniref:uncharacterized protein LOC142850660 n=1 Tax=Microtus pennsylvanicus TaxID=10058 RepID=UPI003F6C60A2
MPGCPASRRGRGALLPAVAGVPCVLPCRGALLPAVAGVPCVPPWPGCPVSCRAGVPCVLPVLFCPTLFPKAQQCPALSTGYDGQETHSGAFQCPPTRSFRWEEPTLQEEENARTPFLPGWARVPARRRSLPRRVPPASAQRGAPAPAASSPPAASLSAPALPAPRCTHSPAAAAAAAARGEAAAQPASPRPARRRRRCLRPAERTRPGTRTLPPGATPRTPPAAPPGRCAAARPAPRARHRAPSRTGGSSPRPPWVPSGWGFRPLLGITPEAPAVAAKFPEETRLPGRCSGEEAGSRRERPHSGQLHPVAEAGITQPSASPTPEASLQAGAAKQTSPLSKCLPKAGAHRPDSSAVRGEVTAACGESELLRGVIDPPTDAA